MVAAGGSLLGSSVTRRVIEEFTSGVQARPHPLLHLLTERERQIVAWVATGRSNEEIAEALVVSPATVRTHVGRAMTKLAARDGAQLVVFGIQSGQSVLSLVTVAKGILLRNAPGDDRRQKTELVGRALRPQPGGCERKRAESAI